MPNPPKRPADMMQLARLIGKRATGEVSETETDPAPKPAAATPAPDAKVA